MTFNPPRRRPNWLILIALIGLGAFLRLYHLGASPLRGDEAFSIRYWAVPLQQALALSSHEPHPFGALFGFGLWKALVGDSEFAMRALPALVNLLGVPALYALGRRLWRDPGVGYVAGLLWALNPTQLYHAQDARDYAIWAGLSAIAMWLLLCACDRRRRVDWLLYAIAAAAALYMYFAEVSVLLVGSFYVLFWRRAVWRGYLIALLGIAVALIPWLAQGWALAHSGYSGTAVTASVPDLWPDLWKKFLPTLIVGDFIPELTALWSMLVLILLWCLAVLIRRGYGRMALFFVMYAALPALLLTLAALKLAVFRADYLLAVTPALLLPMAYGALSLHRSLAFRMRRGAWLLSALLLSIFVGLPLAVYSEYRKAPDWFGVRDYLAAHVRPGDVVLLTTDDPSSGASDPAFDYYYRDRTPIMTLPLTSTDTAAAIQAAAAKYRAIWFMPSGPYAGLVDQALRDNLQLISDEAAGQGLVMREYRAPTLKLAEIEHVHVLNSGGATLLGFSVEQSAEAITVILYWLPSSVTTDTTFIHLIGATNPATNTPLWAQDDHPPQLPSQAPRDVYHIPLKGVPPGVYQLEFGLYNPAGGQRIGLTAIPGGMVTDSALLITVTITDRR